MTQTVKASTASSFLQRAASLDSIASGNRTIVAATDYTGDISQTSVLFFFGVLGVSEDWKLSHRTSQVLQWRYNSGGTNVTVGNAATIYGHWVHTAITRNFTTGDTNAYFLLEGFNPASPAYLITPALGNTTLTTAVDVALWTDDGVAGDSYQDAAFGHWIECDVVLTEAQVLAQFAQRAPIAAVAAASYTYLACDTPASVEVDAGNTATNFNKTSTFAAFASEPSEWAVVAAQPPALFMGSTSLIV